MHTKPGQQQNCPGISLLLIVIFYVQQLLVRNPELSSGDASKRRPVLHDLCHKASQQHNTKQESKTQQGGRIARVTRSGRSEKLC